MSREVVSSQMSCPHLRTAPYIPLREIEKTVEKIQCADCDCTGPNLWICLRPDCLRIGCSEQVNDHNTLHNATFPAHCVHMNLTTQRIWCYECRREVFAREAEVEGDAPAPAPPPTTTAAGSAAATPSVGDCANWNGWRTPAAAASASESSDDGEDGAIAPAGRPRGLVGLHNIGNTCYLNAALQALSNTAPLTNFFLNCAPTVLIVSEGRKPGLSRTFQLLVRDMWLNKNGGSVNPQGVLYGIRSVYPMFRGYQQHDTQEFLRNFMDQLHEELKQAAVPPAGDDNVLLPATTEDPAAAAAAGYDSVESSEGEYETCDSSLSERSSLGGDDLGPPAVANGGNGRLPKRRSSRSTIPSRRLKAKLDENAPTSLVPVPTTNQPSRRQIKYKSIVSDIFDGKLLSTVQCLTCNRVSSRVETFQDLSLAIPSREHLAVIHGRGAASAAASAAAGPTCSEAVLPVDNDWISWILSWLKSWFYGPTITLHDCLAAFFSTDELKGDNMYSCERCSKVRNGIKYSKVLQLPEVLCIHLKRFRHELMFSSKISSTVSFPLKGLDMKPYLHADCVSQVTAYELFSVICHHGTVGGGHYLCYALNNNQWYEFDDQCVTRVSSDAVVACEAYVLFYRKVPVDNEATLKRMGELERLGAEEEERFYISKQWLSRFATCAEPGPIDNRDFLCQHGRICPDFGVNIDQLATAVPKKVYAFLFRKYGGHAAVPTAVCQTCHNLLTRLKLEMQTLLQLNLQSRELDVPATHLLSKSWYQNWLAYVQRKSIDPPGPIDNQSKSSNNDPSQEYAEVHEDIWKFFSSIYGGGPELRINTVADKETSEFIEPERKSPESPVLNSIDKKMYCRGEPMETDEPNEGTISDGEKIEDGPDEVITNGNCEHLTNGNISSGSQKEEVKRSERYSVRKKRENF